jgi:electron transport complex protein RnfB
MTSLALINEAACIGCTKCIQVCPVDSIFGAAKMMHTVIESECIGCTLCVPACPVDCIRMEAPALTLSKEERLGRAEHTRQRVQARRVRLAKIKMPSLVVDTSLDKKARILAALERAKGRS